MDHPNWTGDYIEQDELVEVNMNASNLEYMMARLKEVRQEALDLISNRIKSLNVIKMISDIKEENGILIKVRNIDVCE